LGLTVLGVLIGIAAFAPSVRATFDPSAAELWYSYQGQYGTNGFVGGSYVNPTINGGVASWDLPVNGAPTGNQLSIKQNWIFTYDDGGAAMAVYDGTLLGDLSSKTAATATFRIATSLALGATLNPSQMWYSTPPGGAPPTVRILFESLASSGLTTSWWSNPGAILLLQMANGVDYTLTVNFAPGLWSDVNGVNGAADGGVSFENSLANVTDFGLSFGAGYGFQNGVALMPGVTGSFELEDINTLPVPEPATVIAGALLLLPFGASALRVLRKNRAA
jgi:hypothetical protein